MDITKLSDEELMQIVGQQDQQTDVSKMSDEELLSIAGQQPTQEQPRPTPQNNYSFKSALQDIARPFRDIYGGMQGAGAQFYKNYIPFSKSISTGMEQEAQRQSQQGLPPGFMKNLYAGMGQAVVDIPKYMAAGASGAAPALPVLGAYEGSKTGGLPGAITGGISGGLTQGILGGIQQVPGLAKYPVAFGTGYAMSGGTPQERAASGALITGMSGAPGQSYKDFMETQRAYGRFQPKPPEIIDLFSKAVKPTARGKETANTRQNYYNTVLTAIKEIVKNKGNLAEGKVPENLVDFSKAIESTKEVFYNKYSELEGLTGLKTQISTKSIIDKLNSEFVNKKSALPNEKLAAKTMITYIKGLGLETAELGDITDGIKRINTQLQADYAKASAEGLASPMVKTVEMLREAVDKSINEKTGAQWSQIRNKYAAMKKIEADVNKAVIREAKNSTPGITHSLLNTVADSNLVAGIITANPAMFIKGGMMKAITGTISYFNDPNYQVRKMFNIVEKQNSSMPSVPEQILQRFFGGQPPSQGGLPPQAPPIQPQPAPINPTLPTTGKGQTVNPMPSVPESIQKVVRKPEVKQYITPEEALSKKLITKERYEKIKYGGLTKKQHDLMLAKAEETNRAYRESKLTPTEGKVKPVTIVGEMINTAKTSLDELRGQVDNVRYGKPGEILFEFQGKTYSTPEPKDVLPVGKSEASKSWALRQILDENVKLSTPTEGKVGKGLDAFDKVYADIKKTVYPQQEDLVWVAMKSKSPDEFLTRVQGRDDYKWIAEMGSGAKDPEEAIDFYFNIRNKAAKLLGMPEGSFSLEPDTQTFIRQRKPMDLGSGWRHQGDYEQYKKLEGNIAPVDFDKLVRGQYVDGKLRLSFDPDKVLDYSDTQRLEKIMDTGEFLQKKYNLSPDTNITIEGNLSNAKNIGELTGIKSKLSTPTKKK